MQIKILARNILAVFLGGLACGVVIALVELLGSVFYPLPEGLDPYDREAMLEYIKTMPTGAWLFVLMAWGIGSFCGGWVAAKLAKSRQYLLALIIGAMFEVGGIINMIMIPSPIWMWIGGLLIFLPAAIGGAAVANKRRRITPEAANENGGVEPHS